MTSDIWGEGVEQNPEIWSEGGDLGKSHVKFLYKNGSAKGIIFLTFTTFGAIC